MKYGIFVSAFLVLYSTALSQEYFYSVQHYTVEDGLSDNYISHACQDSKGFLWISTTSGLDRFDGHEFTHYSKENNGLSSNYVEKAIEDKNGKIWVISRGKWNAEGFAHFSKLLDVFDPIIEQSIPVKDFITVDFNDIDIRWYLSDHEKNIWISTSKGELYKYDGVKFHLIFKKEVADNWNGLFAVTTDGNIGYVKNKQFYLLDSIGTILLTTTFPYYMSWINTSDGGKIYAGFSYSKEQDNGILKLWQFNLESHKFDPFVLKNKDGSPFLIDKLKTIYKEFEVDDKNRIWIFADEDFLLFDEQGYLILKLTKILESYGLSPKSIYVDFGVEDLTFLSAEKGFLTIKLRKNLFKDVLEDKVYNIYGGLVDDGLGNVLINQNGILRLDQNHHIIDTIPIFDVSEMIKDENGTIWIGDKYSGIHTYNPESGAFQTLVKPLSADLKDKDNFYILSMHAQKNEPKLLVGMRIGGLFIYDIKHKTFEPFQQYNTFVELKDLVVNHFHRNQEGLWIATNNGLFLMDENKGIIAHYENSENGIVFNEIYHFHEDTDGIFWLGTNGNGLIKWERKSQNAQQFTFDQGLSHQRIYTVYEDELGQLWLSSGYGLMQFDKQSHEVQVWTTEDGLPFDDFVYHFHHQMPNGRLYFGGGNGGVTSFKPNQLEQPTIPLYISSYQEFDNKTGLFSNQSQKVLNGNSLRIEPNVKTVQLKVALFDYTAPQNISYAYNIDSKSQSTPSEIEWNYQKDNIIRLNNLPYGDIELKVVAKGTDNLRTKGILTLPIIVEKPYYLTTEFIVLAILVLIGLIVGFLKWRTYQLKRDNKRLETEVLNRTKIIEGQNATLQEQKTALKNANATKDKMMAIIGHDLRAPLFSLQGLESQINYLLDTNQMDRLKDLGHTMEKSTRFLTDTLNNLLNWSMNQMGRFPYNPEQVDLKTITKTVFNLFEGNAKAKEIQLKMNIQDDQTAFVDQNALSTILRNLISNAIKFTENGGEIIVSGETKDNVGHL